MTNNKIIRPDDHRLKVLLLQSTLSRYNVSVYKIIAETVDLSVAYTIKNECEDEVPFNILKLNYKKICGLFFITGDFYGICSKYDVVIFLADMHHFSYCSLPFIRRKYKVIPWTIGIRSSYTRPYDLDRKKNFIDRLYGIILNRSDAMIFYMENAKRFWGNILDQKKIFIAPNTVEVFPVENIGDEQKNRIIFIGSLYKEKEIYELINAYIEAKQGFNSNNILFLDVIGEGEEYQNIKTFIEGHGLSDYIFLHGPIYNEKDLAKFFAKSLLCISPAQAGLSVLKSMGYGVTFVTRTNAITGGERLNIIDKQNGLLYSSKEELVSIVKDASENPGRYIMMGLNAKEYYNSFFTTNHMAKGFIDAVNYVIGN
jgi:glycosyltransferase involved in cell wall biosynthesis